MDVSKSDANTFLLSVAVVVNFDSFQRVLGDPLFPNPEGVPSGLYQFSLAKFLEARRYLTLPYDETNQRRLLVQLTPQGVMKARELQGLKKAIDYTSSSKPSVIDKLVSDRSQKLVNVGNLLIALLALFVAAVALMRTN